ncbi:hypothetical protein COX86_02990 [Candidatus Micrarchaeota archaeon CG_4_10_14_0_2_um_filter_60_11]|nr:MAG: hypothetical protein AUJ16_00915 [Candidatus Micrarchaeota archaeon CG1_02_60_51]PIN96093.1 MAG: hypothetical protein COU39_02745 [Candidatus Micrarchaeota archaeon CG10_big_fil_rev_8_21_14_0_10_60_32]PIO01599.1 MAG: hypothetical protein COT58_04365 [Candidatus Micrarchaeota archaeon CG09_land_8_20_14_0_10_60_16]PIY91728.1 MAG: hypothetical protein COY71_01660 [Candidatus Micrarchaeota archaeon CG_4_10_14_0_8_um_filter_60_7]PIZ90811.1 MAG: hypothetical protein COX86_02990 [Candidatus Mi
MVNACVATATNEDLLLFSVEPKVSKNAAGKDRAELKHTLKVLDAQAAKKYAKYFSLAREYDGGSGLFSKGWLYAFVGGEDASGFCAIGFDGVNSFLFNELRYKGKTYGIEEGLCKAVFDPLNGAASIKEPKKRVEWRGKGPEYEVDVTVGDTENELALHYSFSRIKPEIGNYRCVFEKFGSVLSYWYLAPMHGRLTINAKGDLAKIGYADLAPLVGKLIESDFGYTEAVHVNVPFFSVGWQWTVLACQSQPEGLKPEKIVGFFDFFFSTKEGRLPLNYQFYTVDLASGKFEAFAEADVKFEEGEIPLVRVSNRDGSVKLAIQNAGPGELHKLKGKRLANFLETADIDYRAYPCVATVTIDGKEYKAVGTSEFAGTGKSYWL